MATYPLNKSVSANELRIDQKGFRQSPMTDNPLRYRGIKTFLKNRSIDGPNPLQGYYWKPTAEKFFTTLTNNQNNPSVWPSHIRQAHAKAMGKLQGEFAQRAELGAALGEWRSSASTIAIRASQLRRSYSYLKRGNFRQFIRELGNPRVYKRHADRMKTGWSRPKDAAALWLEYWFGWSPMVQDIYTATSVLMSPPPLKFEPFEYSSGSSYGSSTTQERVSGNWVITTEENLKQECYVKVGGNVKVSNPNVYYLNALGLLNPVSIGWELIPFSFVADWFGNIGQLLQSTTWDAGVSFEKQYTTVFLRNTGSVRNTRKAYWSPHSYGGGPSEDFEGFCQSRDLSLRSPSFVWKVPVTGSITRAATQVSLLVSLFTKG